MGAVEPVKKKINQCNMSLKYNVLNTVCITVLVVMSSIPATVLQSKL
jgi:hypothetical protein